MSAVNPIVQAKQIKLWKLLKSVNPVFETYRNASEMWGYPLTIVDEIENSIFTNSDKIYDVISREISKNENAKEQNINPNVEPLVKEYHSTLARVYCLIFYLHKEESLYELAVLKPLLNEMGPFADEWREKMDNTINIILNTEKLIAEETKKAEIERNQPFFKVPNNLGDGMRDNLYQKFNKESLFRAMAPYIHNFSDIFLDNKYDEVFIWKLAKDYIRKLSSLPYPETYISLIHKSILNKTCNDNIADITLSIVSKCMLSMIIIMNYPEHLKKLAKKLNNYIALNNFDYNYVLINDIDIPQIIRKSNVVKDYDYTGNFIINNEGEIDNKTFDKIVLVLQSEITSKNTENEDLKKQIKELETKIKTMENNELTKDLPEIDLSQKVIIEILCQMLEALNYKLEPRGNTAKCARLIKQLTGIGKKQIENYIAERKQGKVINETEHKEEIEVMNKLLTDMKLGIYI